MKRKRIKGHRKMWDKMEKQIEAARKRREGTSKKPSKGMRRFDRGK